MREDPVLSVLLISSLLGEETERCFLMENLNYRKKLKKVLRASSLERSIDITSFRRRTRTLLFDGKPKLQEKIKKGAESK